ncbi:MAG: hypothetical protein NC200_05245 [Candidatus Gastranaerophilales bacterium]|nr:hypothetical protein [Candidatus Gastranaerophilales bacterium]
MNIQPTYQARPSFGVKVPVKTAIEAATGRFLDDGKIAYPRQRELLSQLSYLNINKLYTGEMADAMRNMSKVIRERHPELKAASERINKECDIINQDRTFLPADEIIVKEKIDKIWNKEAEQIGKDEIDIAPMSIKDLGLDKYTHL